MKINKYISVIAVGTLLLAITSCSSYLDKDPENSVPEKNVDFTDVSNMYQPVSGVYAKLRTGGMHWVIWPLSIIRDDDVLRIPDDPGNLVTGNTVAFILDPRDIGLSVVTSGYTRTA